MKILVAALLGGGRISIVPDIIWGVEENGYQAHLFGLENVIHLTYNMERRYYG